MEVIEVNHSGRFEVRLGGVVFSNCTKDIDCPGRGYCGINETWSAWSNMCYCDFMYDHTGSKCEESASIGWFYYWVHVIVCVVSVICCIVALYDLARLVKWNRLRRDALSTTLLFVIVSTFFTTLLTGAATRFTVQTVVPNAQGGKRDSSSLGKVALVFIFLFSTLSMMNVSLVWIEIAENAERMKRRDNQNVDRYVRVLVGYYLVFLILLVVSLALDDRTFTAAAALPGTIFIIVTYCLGYFKMRKMLQLYRSSDPASLEPRTVGSKEGMRKVRQSLKAVKWAALGVSFSATGFIISMGFWVLMGGFVDEPNSAINLVPMSLGWVFVASANAIVISYLHGSINRKVASLKLMSNNKGIVLKDTYSDTPRHQTGPEGSLKVNSRKASQEASVRSHVISVANSPFMMNSKSAPASSTITLGEQPS